MATNQPRHGYERKRSQLKTKTMGKSTGPNVVATPGNSWIKRRRESWGKGRRIARGINPLLMIRNAVSGGPGPSSEPRVASHRIGRL
jgi:hypothetical protein